MEPTAGSGHFTYGNDVHFDYTPGSAPGQTPAGSQPGTSAGRKKKKKKRKPVAEPRFKFEDVTLADPDAEYPQSRVIKIGPDGDVIVESLDHEYPQQKPVASPDPWADSADYMSVPGKLESSVLRFKDDQERKFWFGLGDDDRRRILSIDIDMVTERFSHRLRSLHTRPHASGHAHESASRSLMSSCPTCGRHGKSVQDEIEKAYQPHLDDFVESTWKVSESRAEAPPYEDTEAPHDPRDHSGPPHTKTTDASPEQEAGEHPGDVARGSASESEPRTSHQGVKDQILEAFRKEHDPVADVVSKAVDDRVQETLRKFLESGTQTANDFIDAFRGMEPVSVGDIIEFADSIIKNDGGSFIDVLEKSKADQGSGAAWEDEDEHADQLIEEPDANLLHKSIYHGSEKIQEVGSDEDLKGNDTEDEAHEHGPDCYHSHSDLGENSEDEFDVESEEGKALRVEELRGFFMLQAVQIVRDRFRSEFERQMSEDRTQKFIEELEAEELAKKERELKKLKQKEKQKEKKRLQQLAKEEEKRQKEEEARLKAEELKKKQDEVRAEQARRKEELRKKKEEEKLKKIESLRQKEEAKLRQKIEMQKLEQEKAEAQKLKEEEMSKQASKQDADAGFAGIGPTEVPQLGANSEASLPLSSGFDQTDKVPDQVSNTGPSSVLPSAFSDVPLGQTGLPVFSPNLAPAALQNDQWAQVSQPSTFPPISVPQFDRAPNNQLINDVGLSGLSSAWPSQLSGASQQPATGDIWGPSYSRSNSIWGPSSASGSGQSSSIWGNNAYRPSVTSSLTRSPRDLVPLAANEAILALQKSNEAAFGMAPIHRVFQVAKGLMNNSTIGLSEFLRSLNGGTQLRFDIIYDDFGSVTHIKLSDSGLEPTSEIDQRASPANGMLLTGDASRAANAPHSYNGSGNPLHPMMLPVQTPFQTSPQRQNALFSPMMMPQANYGNMNYAGGLQQPDLASRGASGSVPFELGPNNLQRPDSSQGSAFGQLKNGIW